MNSIFFTKMHGLGNDFIIIDHFQNASAVSWSSAFIKKMCHRNFGIGADQLIFIKPSTNDHHAILKFFNADGSEAQMCGNGIRAATLYIKTRYFPNQTKFLFSTQAGQKVTFTFEDQQQNVLVNMGQVNTYEKRTLHLKNHSWEYFSINIGNPHAVFFNLPPDFLTTWGPTIEVHPDFPERTNVELVTLLPDQKKIHVAVWERGAGFTLACGTGACASAVAAIKAFHFQNPLRVELAGGSLVVEYKKNEIWMSGPAQEVFSGHYFLQDSNSPVAELSF